MEEGIKLIVEFMELEKENGLYPFTTPMNDYRTDTPYFDTSWDWLMPVVEKIESLGYEVQVRGTDCCIFDITNDLKYKILFEMSHGGGKKSSTYKAVVEFIKWYNNIKREESLENTPTKNEWAFQEGDDYFPIERMPEGGLHIAFSCWDEQSEELECIKVFPTLREALNYIETELPDRKVTYSDFCSPITIEIIV